jgi:glycerol-3-phosphate O-acyltransferase
MKSKTVEEKIYPVTLPKDEDIEDFTKRMCLLDPSEIKKFTDEYIIGKSGHPNTYTFTKNLTEQLIIKKRGNLPMAITRPSIVGGALKEPKPGWIDSVSGGSGIYLSAGLGVSHIASGDVKKICDQVPVDLVSNGCLIAAAAVANQDILRVYHLGTTARNPSTWGMCEDGVMRYWHGHQPKAGISEPDFHIIKSDILYNIKFILLYSLLARSYGLLSSVVRTKKMQQNAQMLAKVEYKVQFINDNFKFFMMNEWIFDTRHLEEDYDKLSPEEKVKFLVDPKEIDWGTYYQYFCYGLHKWVVKEDPNLPTITKSDLVKQSSARIFSDLNFVNDSELAFNSRDLPSREILKDIVLKSKRVQDAIQMTAEKKSLKFQEVEESAVQIMDLMFANPKPPIAKLFAWLLKKIWRQLYSSIIVDDDEIEKIKAVSNDPSSGPMIILPTHRSYIDFLITSYIFFAYKMPMPHIAAGEDFLNMFMVRTLFRYSGAFFIRRQFFDDELYKCIFTEYVQQLLFEGCNLEFFTEGTRSREGKTLQPKLGLLSVIVEAFFEKKLQNITLLPLHVAYEKLMEGSSYSTELLGQPKKKESLKNLLTSSTSFLKNNYGDISVKFANPISLQNFSDKIIESCKKFNSNFDPYSNPEDKKVVIRKLAYQISWELNKNSVIMPTALVSTILLAYRSGLSREEMISKFDFLKDQIILRGGRLHAQSREQSTASMVDRSIGLLSDVIHKQVGMLEPNVNKKDDLKNFVQLGIYRNSILYLFVEEAMVSCALESFKSNEVTEKGIEKSDLVKEVEFLSSLLSLEFITQEDPDKKVNFNDVIDKMVERGILEYKRKSAKITVPSNSKMHFLLCSMIWPFVESYWVSAMTLFAFQSSEEQGGTMGILPANIQELTARAQWFSQKLYKEGKSAFFESASKIQIQNAYEIFLKWKVIEKQTKIVTEKKNKIKKEKPIQKSFIAVGANYSQVDSLIGFVGKIGRFRRTETYEKSPKSGIFSNFPIISRL